MLDSIGTAIESAIGGSTEQLNALQMAVRTVVVYVLALAIIRLGSKRFLGKASAFDVIVAIMLGSIMSGAITGGSPFVPTLVAGGLIVGLHWLFAVLAVHTDWFGPLVKGTRTLLIDDGKVQEKAIKDSGLTRADLQQAIRKELRDSDIGAVESAYLERDGKISVIPKKQAPQVFEVAINDGVKTVRFEVG